MQAFTALLRASPVIPVLTIDHVADAEPLAQALAAGGLSVVEVTLRTPAALDAITAMKRAAPGLVVGAGTILRPADLDAAMSAGSDFIVTPATTQALVAPLKGCGVPVIPGVATPSEILARLDDGFDVLKLFPAEQYGGTGTIAALTGPLPQARFCPTGGIGRDKVASYLALKNVVGVGGSWIATGRQIAERDWAGITANARAAAAFAGA
ncbi:bifunctional 4-hydroxy-2-oxoglutarate aldolase/2-dehydro-3-deoxy-phosphogluconate aldolase [Niveispirillum fermenti]|uniref:bifunctional 4-hydroxy-2-oxoglutarate aldolase/2-dehydro-3-deoxy-phosphogluconate aldolase n=1 Tax=Niveispirillum fermenti TaxID=1233113 RepID=UPI003A8BF72B